MDQPPPNYYAYPPPPIIPDLTRPPPNIPLIPNHVPYNLSVPPPITQPAYFQPYYNQYVPVYPTPVNEYQYMHPQAHNVNPYPQYNFMDVKQEIVDEPNIPVNPNAFDNTDLKYYDNRYDTTINQMQSNYGNDRTDYKNSSNISNNEWDDSKRNILDQKKPRGKSRDRSWHKNDDKKSSERDMLLLKYRKNFCATSEEMSRKLQELNDQEEVIETWTRSSPADLYYTRSDDGSMVQTTRLNQLCDNFYKLLIIRAKEARNAHKPYEPPPHKPKTRMCRHKSEACGTSSDSSISGLESDEEDCAMEELTRKLNHPQRLHKEMWYNDPGEMNDGPLCRCSARSKRSGIRHGVYPGESGEFKCKPNSNNIKNLYHYRITISPPTNFLTKTPTIIKHDEHEFIFEGFSMFSHTPLVSLPTCKVIRFNIEYTILYVEEKHPEHYTMKELDLFFEYLFHEILELVDFDLKPQNESEDCCPIFHFMPRFVRDLPDNGKEILSMNEVLRYLIVSSEELVSPNVVNEMHKLTQYEWQDYADEVKGMVVTYPGCKPCSVRVDQLDRNVEINDENKACDDTKVKYPEIVHFGIRPPQLSYAGNPKYQKAWREYVKYRHLIANMPKPSFEDKRKLESKEARLQDMRSQGKLKRDVTVALSSKGFYRTGIMCDIIQHAMLIPVLACHLRFHKSLDQLESSIDYKFKNRYLLQLALTHPSYRENFGTNPDHARNSLTNCGIRQPEYGDRKIHYLNTRKRGINTLINIMSRFGKQKETESNINHNERLEFLGDAVVEFLTSIHLFHMFPDLEEGGLATYRAAIVQNQHLAVLAKKLKLEHYMLYAHGSDLCHELELRHAMANCFEALMGALFLDGEIHVADKVFANALFMGEDKLLRVWKNYPAHPLQLQEPNGDRQWIPLYQLLQKLTKFEKSIGVTFRHIRLLARAFVDRSIGFTNLTLGSNQRLEFLGDTVLQLISSEYLYRHFPEHHEGHLSLLRSSLVNNRTQAVVCDDLGMTKYAVYSNPKAELKTKDRADLLEALLGALYIDKGMKHCQVFCQVCLFPRLQDFIMNQDWNDPKSKLQQCCLTLRTMDGGEPDIPVYKVIQCIGPTNTRIYTVAVYFRGKRLATATGHSIQQAEMNCAKQALENSQDLFPQLDHQKRVIAKSMKNQRRSSDRSRSTDQRSSRKDDFIRQTSDVNRRRDDNSSKDKNLPKQYRKADNAEMDSQSDYYDRNVKQKNKRSRSCSSRSSHRSRNYDDDKYSSHHNLSRSRRDYDTNGDYSDTDVSTVSRAKSTSSYRDSKYSQDFDVSMDCFENMEIETNDNPANYKDDVLIYKNDEMKNKDSDLESGEIE